jgi:hypothetical protein
MDVRPDSPGLDDDEYNLISQWIEPHFDDFIHGVADNIVEPAVGLLGNHSLPKTDVMGTLLQPFEQGGLFHRYADWVTNSVWPPDELLVGIEPNPGPRTEAQKAARRARRLRARLARQAQQPKPQQPQVKRQQPRRQQNQGVSIPTSVAAAYSTGLTTSKPVIIRSGDDSCRIKHSEMLTLVAGSVLFSATTFSMQPGLSSSFPWLSTQTYGWEKYKFNSLRAVYYTRTGTGTAGSVILSPDYDAADAAPASEQQATSFHGAADDAPWKTVAVNFDMKRSKELYLRSGPLSANLDIKTYDFANLHVCTADGAVVNWGKIFLEYDVTLLNPQLLSGTYAGGSVNGGGGGLTPALPFGNTPVVTPGSIVASCNGTIINLQNLVVGQKYVMDAFVDGTGLTALTVTASGTLAGVQIIDDLVNGGGTRILDKWRFSAGATSATITITATGASVTGSYFFFSPCNTTF